MNIQKELTRIIECFLPTMMYYEEWIGDRTVENSISYYVTVSYCNCNLY